MSNAPIHKQHIGPSEYATTRYAVETRFFGNTWENCWTDDSGSPVTFATCDKAEQAMKDHIVDCINAVEAGDMEDSPDPTDLRVVSL